MSRDAAYTFGFVLILLGGTCGGLFTIAAKYATLAGVDVTTMNLVRYALGAGVYWLALLLLGFNLRLPRSATIGFLGLGMIPMVVTAYGNLGSLKYLSAGVAALLFYTYPAFVLIGGVISGRDQLSRGRVVALAIALAGCALVVGSLGAERMDPRGIGLALMASLAAAIYMLASERLLPGNNSFVAAAHVQAGAVTMFVGLSATVSPVNFVMSTEGALALAAVALTGNLFSTTAFMVGLRRVGASVAAVGGMMEVVVAVTLGVLLFSEYLGPDRVLGAVLVLGGMFLMQREGRRTRRSTPVLAGAVPAVPASATARET